MLPESALTQCAKARRVYIGYSGGVDSHVLLHLCASIDTLRPKITAVYVHHGLQAVAESWAEHCANIAQDLGVEFLLLRVNASAIPGESPEEAARNARYTALKAIIKAGDVLLVAQHREDQLETVLLQLFRGSGLRGLSGMPESMAFGQGILLRPLLNVEKPAISAYAQTHQLRWIEDPTNQVNDYDRNFLRNAVLPLLKQRWPALDKTVARSAKHCADAQLLVSEVADGLFWPIFNSADKTVCIDKLNAYPNPRQQLVIRQWFGHLGLKMPSQAFVGRILAEVVAAKEDSDPVLSGQGYQVRRYRDKLHCLKHSAQATLKVVIWPMGQASLKVSDTQQLSCVPASTGILREQWQRSLVTVKFRNGGETICLPGRQGHHALKKLFQEAGIPPWERPQMPLVYLDDKLAAVGDHWISAEFFYEKTDACVRLSVQKD